jgi:HlyD family secretion protein
VLTIEPEAVIDQNVTTFPVLVRVANPSSLLRPGMNAEVEIHVGRRNDVVAIPNAALRTQGDMFAAAQVLGLQMDAVNEQLAAQREASDEAASVEMGNGPKVSTVAFRGQQVELPQGLTADEVQPVLNKLQSGGPQAFQSMTDDERAIMRQLRDVLGGPGRGGRGNAPPAGDFEFGGQYVVFAMIQGHPTAMSIRTGLTDLDFSEVIDGLAVGDTVLVLPSASLVQSQQEFQERMQRFGGGIPGVQRSN